MVYRSLTAFLLIVHLFVYPLIILCDLQCSIDNGGITYNKQIVHHVHSGEVVLYHHRGYEHDNPTGHHHSEGNRHEKHIGCLFAHSASYHGILARALEIPGIIDNTPNHYFHPYEVVSRAFHSDIHYRSPPYSIHGNRIYKA